MQASKRVVRLTFEISAPFAALEDMLLTFFVTLAAVEEWFQAGDENASTVFARSVEGLFDCIAHTESIRVTDDH